MAASGEKESPSRLAVVGAITSYFSDEFYVALKTANESYNNNHGRDVIFSIPKMSQTRAFLEGSQKDEPVIQKRGMVSAACLLFRKSDFLVLGSK